MLGVTFEWEGNDVIIRSLYGRRIYTVPNAKKAYYDGEEIVVIGNFYNKIRFTKDGIRRYC